jgi:3-oxoacyl-[acyl-carrier-protein] synthase II
LPARISAVVTACATSNNCIGEAWRLIRDDEADVILAGGSEAACVPLGMSGFAAMRALSTRNDDPERASRPFDRDRDGFVMGEGAGIVIVEELEHAKKRGAPSSRN